MSFKSLSIQRFLFCSSLGFLLWGLFHFESMSLGPVKVSHLWKGALLGILMVKVLSRGTIRSSVYNPLLLLVVLGLCSLELIHNPLNAIFTFLTTIIIPMIGVYTLEKEPVWCRNTLHFLAAFFILSFVPYELGLLSSLGREGYDMAYSYSVDGEGAIGPFQTVHSASTALAGALLVILYFLLTSEYNRLWLVSLFALGFYLLFSTYVRTGMAMFALGGLLMLGYLTMKSQRMLVRATLLGLVSALLVSAWVLPNDALMARILGERSNKSEYASFETLGSGRGGLAIDALVIYREANFVEKVIGMGITEQKRRLFEIRGQSLVPHNGFLGILIHQGALGLIFFVWFLVRFWKAAGRLSRREDLIFIRSLFLAYFIMTFFQNYTLLYMPVLMMLAFSWKISSCNKVVV